MNYGIAQSANFVASAPLDVRTTFIRRVYSLLLLSLAVTVGVGAFAGQPGIAEPLMGLWPVLAIAQFGTIIALNFVKRNSGLNMALFMLFASLTGMLLGPYLMALSQVAPGLPIQAAMLTLGVFGGLTLYVFQSKKDFSFLGGFLFAAIIALLITGVVAMLFSFSGLYMIYTVAGVLVFSGFVLYDTSQIIHHLEPNQAVTGAIELYLDFLNLFLFILRLLSNNRD